MSLSLTRRETIQQRGPFFLYSHIFNLHSHKFKILNLLKLPMDLFIVLVLADWSVHTHCESFDMHGGGC